MDILRENLLDLLKTNDVEKLEALFGLANLVRAETVGNQVCIHGIIEFSNYCRSFCAYCGIRAPNEKIQRYRMPLEKIKETAINASNNLGYKMLVLQSGEDLWYDVDKLAWLIKSIHKKCRRCLLFLSIGDRDYDTYKNLYKAGARGALFRFETSDEALYKKLHPDCSFAERIEKLKFMREIGYLTASGPIIGLPGQTMESLLDDIYLMKELKVTMTSMGPFIPTSDTSLEDEIGGTADLTLKMIALTRLIYPKARIPIATALEKIGGNKARIAALNGGGNAFMLNLTPPQYRDSYAIYNGKNQLKSHIHSKESIDELSGIIKSCGRKICRGWGTDFTLNKKNFASLCNMER